MWFEKKTSKSLKFSISDFKFLEFIYAAYRMPSHGKYHIEYFFHSDSFRKRNLPSPLGREPPIWRWLKMLFPFRLNHIKSRRSRSSAANPSKQVVIPTKRKNNCIIWKLFISSEIFENKCALKPNKAYIRGGPTFGPVKYVEEVSHVKHMHADSLLIHPKLSSKLIITWLNLFEKPLSKVNQNQFESEQIESRDH